MLDDLELSEVQEVSVLEFCCEVSSMPYNRRTSRSLRDIIRQGTHTQKLLQLQLQLQLVFQILIWIRIHMFLGPPDPLVKGINPDLDPSIIKQ